MSREIYRYGFSPSVPPDEIEGTLLLAVLATESLHGESHVRLDASYCFDADMRSCVIDAGTDVGRDICRMFTGFATREYGERSFSVRRVDRMPEPEAQEVPA
ncbi:MAG: hypothetical protein GY842_27665 [bacterium]|nr:hypothetical protein [bacterium]